MKGIAYSELCILQDPRYFTYDPETDSWALNEDRANRTSCAAANGGAEYQRVMPWGPWEKHPHGIKSQFAPYKIVGDSFDLNQWNPDYFRLVHRLFEIAAQYGIKTYFCWADECQFRGDYKKWSPWITNTNGVAGLYDPKAEAYFAKWLSKCVDEFGDIVYGWAWGNENQQKGFRTLARNVIHPFVKKRGLDPLRMAYGAVMEIGDYEAEHLNPKTGKIIRDYYGEYAGPVDDLKKDAEALGDKFKLAVWKEVHGCGKKGLAALVHPSRVLCALSWWARRPANGIRVWLSDDGVKDGLSKCDVAEDGARTSAATWAEIIKAAIDKGANDFMFEHLPQGTDMDCQKATLREMYKAANGKYPKEKWTYVPPVVEPPPPDDPPPAQDCSCANWLKRDGGRRPDVWRWLLCVLGLGKKRCI